MSERAWKRMLGARLLAEANDIKRTPEALAAELGVPFDRLRAAFEGELTAAEYRALFEAVSARYPIGFGQLWIEPSEAAGGIVHMTAAMSKASARVFDRARGDGGLAPYYEYRDTAMARTAPFRPEWIRPLRVVDDLDPRHPDVAYNKGHFLHQTTLFVGPVNFYWDVDGIAQCAAMDTGDSNYITPFRPHSFASRNPACPGYIVAVTYGGEVARARDDLARLGPDALPALTFELRDEAAAHAALLRRHLAHEAMSPAGFVERCAERKLAAARVDAALAGRAVPTFDELHVMADVLQVTLRDLLPPTRRPDDEVVIARRPTAEPYPDATAPAYAIRRLARSRQQSSLKSFLIGVLPGGQGPALTAGLHQYVFNHGEVPVRVVAGDGAAAREVALAPQDSAYVEPLVPCRFLCDGPRAAELFVVRIPGALHAEAIFELSAVAPDGLRRAAAETTRWF